MTTEESKKMHTVLELYDSGVCESEPKQLIYVCEGEPTRETNLSEEALGEIHSAIMNLEQGDTLTIKRLLITDEQWQEAVRWGEEMA